MADHPGSALERAALRAVGPLLLGLAVSAPLLLLPRSSSRQTDFLIHLIALVAFSLALTWRLAPLSSARWFPHRPWSMQTERLVSSASLIVIVTGVTALVTIASSAAMQYQPSLQYLQLLSALDIAWVVAGTMVAARLLWGQMAALVAGWMMSVVCVLSIKLYLDEVGLTDSGAWLVDGEQMLRLVIPFDVAAALIAVGLSLLAARRAASPDRTGQSPVV